MSDVWNGGVYRIEYKENRVEERLLWESHCHAKYELIAVLEGDITVAYEGRKCRVGSGECVILSPLVYHTIASNRQGNYSRVTVEFDPCLIPTPLRSHFLACEREIFLLPFADAKRIRDAYLSANRDFFAPLVESVLICLFYEAYPRESDGRGSVDPDLSRMLAYIDAHLSERVTLPKIASAAALSESSVCHIFKEKMGTSPIRYLNSKRLALAQKLIGEGVSATEAAMRAGYEDYSNFFRAYKSYFGKSPSQSR